MYHFTPSPGQPSGRPSFFERIGRSITSRINPETTPRQDRNIGAIAIFGSVVTAGLVTGLSLVNIETASVDQGDRAIECAIGQLDSSATTLEVSHAIETCYGIQEPQLNGDILSSMVQRALEELAQR